MSEGVWSQPDVKDAPLPHKQACVKGLSLNVGTHMANDIFCTVRKYLQAEWCFQVTERGSKAWCWAQANQGQCPNFNFYQ